MWMISEMDKQIAALIEHSQRILMVSHVRPDADAAGSLLGLGLALMDKGKHVQMVLQDGAGNFAYLPQHAQVTRSPQGEVDMVIVVDCSDPDRVGNVLEGYGSPDLVVDHHKTNLNFGTYNIVEPEQVATASIIFDHLESWGLAFSEDVATCLLSGIVGDTIGFRTPNVNSDVLRKSAALMDMGADLADVYQNELIMKPYTAIRYWGSGLNRLQYENGLVWTSLTLADRNEIGYARNDDADLVNVLSSIKEASIAMIFVEQSPNEVKISWRAKPGYDVSGIALAFGGGGHAAAAGADVMDSLQNVQPAVITQTKQLLYNIRKG
jgi:phosphoesterase RecJ-like protein